MTQSDATDSVGCTTTMDSEAERLRHIRWCDCGQPWIPAVGLYGTTEETECPGCVLRRVLTELRQLTFIDAVSICQRYAVDHPEHAQAAGAVAMRIAQEATK